MTAETLFVGLLLTKLTGDPWYSQKELINMLIQTFTLTPSLALG
jgi:hypothetical protein